MWYRAGLVNVTNGSTTVTGTSTNWISGAGVGEAFYGPDGRVYEIANIVSATSLTLGSAYLGSTQTGQTYQIVPTQSYIRSLAAEAAALVASYSNFGSEAGQGKFTDGTAAQPGIRFTADENTGIRRAGDDDMRLVSGGVDQASITQDGLLVRDDKLRITGSADATKRAAFEVDGFTTGTTRTFTLPNVNTTLVGTDNTATLTNKTINLSSNTLTATSAQLAASLTDETGTGFAVFSASPALTGTPTAPTAAAGTNTTQLATTAHVFAERTNTATLTNKTINIANNTLTGVAPLASPTFTGTPAAPTATAGTNTTQLATTAFVGTAVTNERTAIATLTNKTLTSPVISTISNTGTLTLPTSTDTLVGRSTTDTLTNKTITGGTVNPTTLQEASSPVVVQTDIGTAPNEIPLNGFLGNMAFQDSENIGGSIRTRGSITSGGVLVASAGLTATTGEFSGGTAAAQSNLSNFVVASSAVLRGGATNLLLRSQEFNDAAWTKSNASITANTVVAPDGTLAGYTFTDSLDGSVAAHALLINASFVSGAAYTQTLYAKAGTLVGLSLLFPATAFTSALSARFNISTGVVASTDAGVTATITAVGNGWYRCSATATATATAVTAIQLRAANSTTSFYQGTGTGTIFIWGAQLEASATPGPYIRTTAQAITTPSAAPIEAPNGLALPLLASSTPARNSDMTVELTNNTTLTFRVRGSDGTVRSATLTLA